MTFTIPDWLQTLHDLGFFIKNHLCVSTSYLFPSKNTLVVKMCQLLICSVDVELLKTIYFTLFKPKNIKQSKGWACVMPESKAKG